MSELWDGVDKDKRIDEIVKRILMELQDNPPKDAADSAFAQTISQLSDVDYIKRMLNNVENASRKFECDLEKREVIKGMILITWLQRMHSTIRSLLFGLVAAAILIPVLLYFGSLDMIQNILLAFPIFVSGLVVTRLLDRQIINAAKKTVRYLSKHKKLRNFVMDHF